MCRRIFSGGKCSPSSAALDFLSIHASTTCACAPKSGKSSGKPCMICGAARARLCLGNALEHTSLAAVPPASFEFIPFLKAACMPLITLDQASFSYELQLLLDTVELNIERYR